MTDRPLLPLKAKQQNALQLSVPDQRERERIAVDLDHTLFVEAGAGTGKTTALVSRIMSMIQAGTEVANIAAITYTEKAAAELRQRIRDRLESDLAVTQNKTLRIALSQLDAAAISTLHAFAQRILFEHSIEAKLPPDFEVLDEINSQMHFDKRWQDYLPTLLNNPSMAETLLIADVLGIQLDNLRILAQQFDDNWDLAEEQIEADPSPLTIDISEAVKAMQALRIEADKAINPEDKLAQRLREVSEYGISLIKARDQKPHYPPDRIIDVVELLVAPEPRFGTEDGAYKSLGNKKNWHSSQHFADLKERLFRAGQLRDAALEDLRVVVIHKLAAEIADFVLTGVEERRIQGRLRFHDLLVFTRQILRDKQSGPVVRKELRNRYQRLLIDEFQDTDPIQVDIVSLIAGKEESAELPWPKTTVIPGRLFFVGDPKQSIYRFRRGDMATYLLAQKLFGGEQGGVRLSVNFRSTKPIIHWINRTFKDLISQVEGSQPKYAELKATRPPPKVGPGVLVLGANEHSGYLNAQELRNAEATEVVEAIKSAIGEEWSVRQHSSDGEDGWKPASFGDIAVLLPTRTALSALELALNDADIPYRAETTSLVYATPEVRDLLMVARAVDDPTDELAIVSALRTPAFGCGDDDLYLHKQIAGTVWDYQSLPTDFESSPVVDGLRWMAILHAERSWLSPSEILDKIIRQRRLFELGVCQGRHRETWRRLRFVVDQARAWSDSSGGDLQDYLHWVQLQGAESARVTETVLPETDSDAVRIMTVHTSKGLEFPITIVSGLTTQQRSRHGSVNVSWSSDEAVGYSLGNNNTTPAYDRSAPINEQLDRDEWLRVLYVACTRACDHLVISMHRNTKGAQTSLAALLGKVHAQTGQKQIKKPAPELPKVADVLRPSSIPNRFEWERSRREALANAHRTQTIAATALNEFADLDPSDPDLMQHRLDTSLPLWQKGRYGTAIGRAVHGVLQTIPFDDEEGLAAAAASQAATEGIQGSEKRIMALTQSALSSSIVAEAKTNRSWREIFVASSVGALVIEGYIDLVFERSDGLVVVDYKTDSWRDGEDLDTKVERYEMQIGAYAIALAQASGQPVAEAILLFLSPNKAVERRIANLPALFDRVLAAVPEGSIAYKADPTRWT